MDTKQLYAKARAKAMAEIQATRRTRWWRFGIVAAIYTLWVIWLGNYWFLLGLPLLFDIYITGFIPFTWWKKSKNATVRTVMSWVDAIVYALILVYFIFNFVGQNYQIPSSSLEKTLLTGDYLWVNKLVYGPRVPMTPIHFPLVHNTMPLIGTNSYSRLIENDYRRLPGLRSVERNDIVVFNFPAGDTVATKYEESPEYYELLVDRYGWKTVNTDKERFGDVIYRPVDRRTNFVKRAVGLPGETLRIVNDVIYIDGKAQKQPENVQFVYAAALTRALDEEQMKDMDIAPGDVQQVGTVGALRSDMQQLQSSLMALEADQRAAHMDDLQRLGRLQAFLNGVSKAADTDILVQMPMTKGMIDRLTSEGQLKDYIKINDAGLSADYGLFPKGVADEHGWTLSNYGGENGIIIPKKGMTVQLTPYSWKIYQRAIRNYENHPDARLGDDGKVYIGGKPADTYTFTMDYYFMMGDNRDMSQDSRFWGFVPEDHVVGTPMFVLISFDKDRSIFNGGIRWHRIFRSANPDK